MNAFARWIGVLVLPMLLGFGSGYLLGTPSFEGRTLASQEESDSEGELPEAEEADADADAYSKVVENRDLVDLDGDLSVIFPQSETGQALARLSLLETLSEDLEQEGAELSQEEGQLRDDEITFLKSRPQEALLDIKIALVELPVEYAAAHQSMIQLAADLELSPDDKLRFFREEAIRPLASTDVESRIAETIARENAFENALSVAQDPREAEGLSREILRDQRDAELRRKFLAVYSAYDAEGANRLSSELNIIYSRN